MCVFWHISKIVGSSEQSVVEVTQIYVNLTLFLEPGCSPGLSYQSSLGVISCMGARFCRSGDIRNNCCPATSSFCRSGNTVKVGVIHRIVIYCSFSFTFYFFLKLDPVFDEESIIKQNSIQFVSISHIYCNYSSCGELQ